MIAPSMAILLLIEAPGWAQSTDWRLHRDTLLGPGRHRLMQFCSIGRRLNDRGLYYWTYSGQQPIREELLLKGYTEEQLDSDAGKAAAMSIICPDVK